MNPLLLGAAIAAIALASGKKSAPAVGSGESVGTTGPDADSHPTYSPPSGGGAVTPGGDSVSVAGEAGGTQTVSHDGAGPIVKTDTGNSGKIVPPKPHPIHVPTQEELRKQEAIQNAHSIATATAAEGAAGFGPASLGLQIVASQYAYGLTKRDTGKVVAEHGPAAGAVW